LLHCHFHDNSGEADEHKAVGDRKENWPELLNAVRSRSPDAILVAESDRLDRNRISIEKLRSFQQSLVCDSRGSTADVRHKKYKKQE